MYIYSVLAILAGAVVGALLGFKWERHVDGDIQPLRPLKAAVLWSVTALLILTIMAVSSQELELRNLRRRMDQESQRIDRHSDQLEMLQRNKEPRHER